MTSMYKQYGNDKAIEQAGIWLEFGSFRIRVARAGGTNMPYKRFMETILRKNRRAIETGTMPNDVGEKLHAEAYAKTVILQWQMQDGTEVNDDGIEVAKYIDGIETPDGGIMPATPENIMKTLMALPELFIDIRQQAQSLGNFREFELEADSKN